MSKVFVIFRMEEADKRRMEAVCKDLGMSMSTAFTIFAKKMTREHRIPFEVSGPVYPEPNPGYLFRDRLFDPDRTTPVYERTTPVYEPTE